MHLFKQWPKVDEGCTPSNIIWENIGISKKQVRLRTCYNWIAAIVILIISTTLTIIIMNNMSKLASQFNFKIDCPADAVVRRLSYKKQAYLDQ